ncbi:Cytochrome P450 - like 10 [Theobroma cacao]|nr:Cytochrome P450 - like 10 [Theobroma cacao]
MGLLLFFVILALRIVVLFFLRKRRHNPPNPLCLPLICSLLQLNSSPTPHIFLWKLSQKYGPLMSLQLGLRPTLVFSSQKMAKTILKAHDLDFCSRPRFLGQHKLERSSKFATFISLIKSRVLFCRPIREDEVAHMIK